MHLLICALLGGTSVLAMAPWGWFPALIIGLSGLYYCLTMTTSMFCAFAKGWIFGFSYFFFGLMWIGNALLVEGNEYAWAWPLAVCGLPLLLAFFTAFACSFVWKFSDLKTIGGYLAFAGYLALFEWIRGHAFTGFPWNLYGHTWIKTLPVLQTLSLVGPFGLTFLTVLWCSLPAFFYCANVPRQHKQIVAIAVLASFFFSLSFGYTRLNTAGPTQNTKAFIRLVQPNIPQSDKWVRNKMWGNFLRHITLSRPETKTYTTGTTYIVWPETSLNQWILNEPRAMYLIRNTLSLYHEPAYLMTGFLRSDDKGRFFNSFVLIDNKGNITNIYNKEHLVPFGEYIPFQKWIPLEPVSKFRGFSGENTASTFTAPDGLRYSPAICYEIIFPKTFSNQKNHADVIFNVTNDSWYGLSAGPWQHFYQAVFRGIEQGLPVVRVADTGISGVIDPYGRMISQSSLQEVYAATVPLPLRSNAFRMQDLGKNAIFFILLAFSIAWGFFGRKPSVH